MAFIIEDNGDITLTQGDSGIYPIDLLPTDKDYTLYFAVQDENRKPIGEEIAVQTLGQSYVEIVLLASFTDNFKVPNGEETATYYFGLKLCSTNPNREETLLIENKDIGDENIMTVYPRKVKGND